MTDRLDVYLDHAPRDLTPKAWAAWRKRNPPPYLLWENRKNPACGVCGEPLRLPTRICIDCHRHEITWVRLPA